MYADLNEINSLVGCTVNNQYIEAFFFRLPSKWQYRHEDEYGGMYLGTPAAIEYYKGTLMEEGVDYSGSTAAFEYIDDTHYFYFHTENFLISNTQILVYEEDGKLHIEGYGCNLVLQETSENIWEVISDDAEITVIKNEDGNDTRVTIKKGTKFEWKYSVFE